MKDIKPKLIDLFKKGYCTPQIARIAKQIKEPSTTIHYNIKKLEKEGAIKDSVIKLNYIFTISEKMIKKLLFSLSSEKKKIIASEFIKKLV